MNIKSNFNKLQTIKRSLEGSINNQLSAISDITTGYTDFEPGAESDEWFNKNFSYSAVIDATNMYNVMKLSNTDAITIEKYTKESNTRLSSRVINCSDFYPTDSIDLFNDLGEVESAITPIDIAKGVEQGQELNVAISSACDCFLAHTTNSVGDVLNYINTSCNNTTADVKEFERLLILQSSNGELSQAAFLATVGQIYQSLHDATQDDTLEMDESLPFALRSFADTVLNVIQASFSLIITTIGLIVGGVLAVIASAISTVVSVISSLGSDELTIHPELGNSYLKGSILANGNFPSYGYTDPPSSIALPLEQSSLKRLNIGPFELDAWKSADKISLNGFLHVCVNPNVFMYGVTKDANFEADGASTPSLPRKLSCIDSVKNVLLNNRYFTYSGGNITVHPIDIGLSGEDMLRLQYDYPFCEALFRSNCMIMASLFMHRWSGGVSDYTLYYDSIHAPSGFYGATFSSDPIGRMVQILLWNLYWAWFSGDPLNWQIQLPSISDCVAFIQALRNNSNITSLNHDASDNRAFTYNDTYAQNNDIQGKFYKTMINDGPVSFFQFHRPNPVEYPDVYEFNINNAIDNEIYSSLPEIGGIEAPSYSTAEIWQAFLLTAAMIAATCVTTKIVKGRLAVRKQMKLAKRTKSLNDKRDKYIKHPDNEAYAADYKKALKSYNTKASILGWPSYDSANGWMNSAADNSGGASSSSVASLVTNLSNGPEVTLSDVLYAIKGSMGTNVIDSTNEILDTQ